MHQSPNHSSTAVVPAGKHFADFIDLTSIILFSPTWQLLGQTLATNPAIQTLETNPAI